jgi:phosphoglycerol transferase MdoB-like AlkP superfamily enzyme
MFPRYGGNDGWDHDTCTRDLIKTNVHSLPEILKLFGYTSIFIGSENEEAGGLDDMAANLLYFDSVFCQEKILSLINEDQLRGYSNTLSDHQLMQAVINFLQRNEPAKKFFLSAYNLGTHAWFDSPEEGKKYKEGENPIYNVVFNFDDAFGKFWEYFLQSPYSNNTIVILTADHCACCTTNQK